MKTDNESDHSKWLGLGLARRAAVKVTCSIFTTANQHFHGLYSLQVALVCVILHNHFQLLLSKEHSLER